MRAISLAEVPGTSASDRRSFLKFLAASPLFASIPAFAQTLEQASDALDVFDLQAAAQKVIPPAHWGYLMTGVDGEETLKANRDGYAHYQLKTRRFVDVSKMDMSVEQFGMKFNSPIVLCPVGSQRAFPRDGEVGVARAARAKGHLQILSTQTSIAVEDVIKARGGPIWYQ